MRHNHFCVLPNVIFGKKSIGYQLLISLDTLISCEWEFSWMNQNMWNLFSNSAVKRSSFAEYNIYFQDSYNIEAIWNLMTFHAICSQMLSFTWFSCCNQQHQLSQFRLWRKCDKRTVTKKEQPTNINKNKKCQRKWSFIK